MPRNLLSAVIMAASVSLLASHSQAMNILLSNDDGLTANVKALQSALQAAGHNVIVSVPCQNQSGKGASLNFLTPILPLSKACVGNAAAAGAAGVGAIAGISNAHYVDGTPIMALMYGLDILAPAQWGAAPDLVISGPNEGQNIGSIVISSGTVSNAQYALTRGIAAIAVSADVNTTKNDLLAAEVAALTVKLVDKLDARAGKHGLLPRGMALNVNYPVFNAGDSEQLNWKITRFGNFDYLNTRFVTDLGADPGAAAYGLGNVHFPGVVVSTNSVDSATTKTDKNSEALQNLKGHITVTPMQFGYEVAPAEGAIVGIYLQHALRKQK